jgi:mono/diheme cytochrome c family protein
MHPTVSACLIIPAAFCLAAFVLPRAWAQPDPAALVRERCTVCHNLTRVRDKIGANTAEDWTNYIGRMQKRGARVSDAEKAAMAGYLSTLPSGDGL